MNEEMDLSAPCDDLRRRAEDEALKGPAGGSVDQGRLSASELERALHELRVHQIELELQNEELRRAREELEVSRARYFDLYDLAPVGYLSLNDDGLIVEVNLTFALMLGRVGARAELVRQSLSRFIVHEDWGTYSLHWKELADSRQPQTCDLRMVRDDGTQFWARLAMTAPGSEGGPACLVAVVDITERKKAEEDQARLQEEMAQAQKMETVGRLAGGVAHDLNNLLTPILGYSQLLLSELAPEDGRKESVEEILRAAERARDLVRQLLNFSRRQLWTSTLIDLNETVSSFAAMLRRTIREDIVIEFTPAPTSLCILGDANQLGQVLVNLAVNAQDAMPDGGVLAIATAEVQVDRSSSDGHGLAAGRYAVLRVHDTGRGMDIDTKKQVFEPFFTTKAKGMGTGLGLATVYTIVKQHGGSISVWSEPGRGATFEMYFAAVEGRPAYVESAGVGGLEAGLRGSECILLVEDNPQVRDLTQAILERLGYTVFPAENAREALKVLAECEGSVDMVLSDVVMPGMKGPELVAKITQAYPRMKALLMSGYTDDVSIDGGAMAAGVRFLQKPFPIEALARSVREALDG